MFPILPLALVLASDLAAPAIHDVSVPVGLQAVTSNPEFSGIVWSPVLKRYLIVTDDTGLPDRGTKRTPLVVALSENGTLDSEPVPIAGIKKMDDAESICAGPDGTFFLATSHSPNDDGETHKSRRLLLHLKVANRSLKVLGQLDLTELDGSQSLLEVAGLPKDGRLDVEALAYRDRSLYIGLKSPLAKNGAAVILRLSDPVKAAHDRRVRVGSLVAFAQVLLCIPVDDQSVCQGLSEMTFLADGSLVATANAPKGGPKDHGGSLWHLPAPIMDTKPILLYRFAGLAPEGVTLAPNGRELTLVFDTHGKTPKWTQVPLPEAAKTLPPVPKTKGMSSSKP
jgi:hypothetical protein